MAYRLRETFGAARSPLEGDTGAFPGMLDVAGKASVLLLLLDGDIGVAALRKF